jgi:predicted DNA-binding protein (UPF0251 family)
VDGRLLGHGLPARPIGLLELSVLLLHPSYTGEARDAGWRLLVELSRTGGDRWVVAAVAVALPGLRRRACLLRRACDGDVEAALVEQFLRVLATADTDQPGVVTALLNSAFTRARRALGRRPTKPGTGGPAPACARSVLPGLGEHPDLVLARAVRRAVLTTAEAELIGLIFLERITVADYAAHTGQSASAVYKRRAAAVTRLAAALRAGDLADLYADTIAEATGTGPATPAPVARRPDRAADPAS